MDKPDFTNDEQYLVNFMKSSAASGDDSFMWGYIIGTGVLAAIGWFQSNLMLLLFAFVAICAARIYEAWSQSRWTPLWVSIIAKYEQLIETLSSKNMQNDSKDKN